MIFRLTSQQTEEDEHKLWCDKEISKTEAMRDTKQEKVDTLDASIKMEMARVTKLTEEIQNTDEMLSDIESFQKESTEIRNEGKKENAAAIKDAQTAETA